MTYYSSSRPLAFETIQVSLAEPQATPVPNLTSILFVSIHLDKFKSTFCSDRAAFEIFCSMEIHTQLYKRFLCLSKQCRHFPFAQKGLGTSQKSEKREEEQAFV